MEIRMLNQPEILPALHLVWEVYADAVAPTASPEGVASFRKFIDYDYISQMRQRGNLVFFGAYDGGMLCGTLALRPDGHIALFFVKKERQGQGIGRMLFQYAYHYCAQHLSADRLTVNAAPGAVERYIHMGMRPVSGEQERDGVRYVPMEMYVNLGMVSSKGQKSKTPWIALGVFGVILLLVLIFLGVSAYRDLRREFAREWTYEDPEEDEYGNFFDEYDEYDEYGGYDGYDEYGGYEDSGELSGIDAIPEMIDEKLPYEMDEETYTFSDEDNPSMMIEFQVTYPEISGLPDASIEKKVNGILKARAMENVNRIYEDPAPEIKERVIAEEYPLLINYVDYKICYASKDVLSVVYEDYSYEGGQSYYAQYLRTCNIDLRNGEVYEVKDIVDISADFLDVWLEVMRREAGDDTFLSELDQDTMQKALEGDSQDGVYVVNFFLDADGIEIGFDLNYEEDNPDNRGYVWVTAPFTFDEIEEYASDSDFWKRVR